MLVDNGVSFCESDECFKMASVLTGLRALVCLQDHNWLCSECKCLHLDVIESVCTPETSANAKH